MSERIKTTLEDLYRVPEDAKAEIVDGELILMAPMGGDCAFPRLVELIVRHTRPWGAMRLACTGSVGGSM